MSSGPTSSCIWGYGLWSIPNQRDTSRGFLLLGNPWECKSRRYDHDHLVPRSLRDLWDNSESHFLPGLHISWLAIPQTSPGTTAQVMDSRDVSVGSLWKKDFCSSSPLLSKAYESAFLVRGRGCVHAYRSWKHLASAVPLPSAPSRRGWGGLSSSVPHSAEGTLHHSLSSFVPAAGTEERDLCVSGHPTWTLSSQMAKGWSSPYLLCR